MHKKKNNGGFSLIELIIAIAILIILTGLLAPQFMKYIEKSREAKDMQMLDSVYTAVQGALVDEKAYADFLKTTGDGAALASLKTGMKLETLLDKDVDFAKEFKNILGTNSNYELASKKADKGEIYVRVTYEKDKDASDSIEGLAVTVYCGDSAGKKTGDLDEVGAPYTN